MTEERKITPWWGFSLIVGFVMALVAVGMFFFGALGNPHDLRNLEYGLLIMAPIGLIMGALIGYRAEKKQRLP